GGGAGKLALVPVSGEPVQRIGPDLGLDPLLSQGRDLVGGAVDLDHVGLPAVDVAVVGRRGLDDVMKALRVAGGDPRAGGEELTKARELWNPNRTEDVREAVVQARVRDLEASSRLDPVVAHSADRVGKLGIVGRDSAAFAGRDDLSRVGGEAGERAPASAWAAAPPRAPRARRALPP